MEEQMATVVEDHYVIFLPCVTFDIDFGGSPKPLHLKPGHQNGIFQRKVPSRQRLFCLDGAFPV